MFQKVEIAPEIGSDSKLQGAVENAMHVLEQAVGDSSRLLRVQWEKTTDDKNRPLVRVRLKDWTGEVEGYFAPQDLTSDDTLRGRFYKLYGDLLQIRSHKQLEELLAGAGASQNQ